MDQQEQILDDLDFPTDSTFNSRIAKWTALVSFIIGTLLLVLGLISIKFDVLEGVVFIGYLYIQIAFFINVIVFIATILSGNTKAEKKINRKMAAMMLLNIPIAILYLFILMGAAFS